MISEPPPSATREDLNELVAAVFGSTLLDAARLRYPTGVDGWLEDVVLRVRARDQAAQLRVMSGHDLQLWSLPASLVQRLQWIHRALQSTNEGFYVDNLDAIANRPARPSIPSVAITAKDVNAWLTPTRDWTGLGGLASSKLRWAQIDQLQAPQALHSSDGLTALVIPAGTRPELLAPALRLYGIASDLTVAAVQPRRGATVLLGRARQLPLTLLPPLRLESVTALMRTRGQEMGQSYERGRIFAGKVGAGTWRGWDWAPIYLSQPLEDSEFGTLLNLADQVLKSWSERGEIEYFAFDYARPAGFPFAQRRASEFFSTRLNTRSLTFNWNTTGYSTLVGMPVGQVLTVDRSGALPITYLPGDGSPERRTDPATMRVAREGADTARAYFDRLGDPLLVRVAQQVLLFHAFGAMQTGGGASAQADAPRGRTEIANEALKQQAQQWLGSPNLAQSLTPDLASELSTLRRLVSMNDAEAADLLANPHGRRASNQQEQLHRDFVALEAGFKSANELVERTRSLFARMCSDLKGTLVPIVEAGQSGNRCNYSQPTTMPASVQVWQESSQAVKALQSAVQRQEKEYEQRVLAFRRYIERLDSARRLALKVAGRAGDTWEEGRVLAAVMERAATIPANGSIRTPSVVLSYDAIEFFSIGGHNIGASPVRVHLDGTAVRPGVRRMGEDNVLTMSADHLSASGDIARRGLDGIDPGAQRPPQTVAKAFHLEADSGSGGGMLPPPPTTSAFRAVAELPPGGRKLTDADVNRYFANDGCTVCVLREGELGYHVLEKGPPSAVLFVSDATRLSEVISATRNHKLIAIHGEPTPEAAILMAANVRVADVQGLLRGSPVRRAIESAKAYFADVRPGSAPTVSLVHTDARGATTQFVLHGGSARAFRTLDTRVSPRDAQVLDAPDRGVAWLRDLGDLASRFGVDPPVTEIRFPAKGAAPRIEVRVVARTSAPVGTQTSTVRQAILRAPDQAELATVLDGVRAELKARLNSTELLFHIDSVGGDLRVADAQDRR